MCVYVCVHVYSEREREKQIDVEIVAERDREIYYKKSKHVIVELASPQICRVDWQTRDPGKTCV